MSFERGRQTRNLIRLNTRYSLLSPIKVDNLKIVFEVYEHILLANIKNEKVSTYRIAKRVGLVVNRDEIDENVSTDRDSAYEHKLKGVAVSRKKKTAIDAISNVVESKFG